MNTLLNDTHQDLAEDLHPRRDREINLGTSMVLGIFFALAVLCSVFFGFGYSLGVKHLVSTPPNPPESASSNSAFSNFKPSPGNPLPASSTAKPSALKPDPESPTVPTPTSTVAVVAPTRPPLSRPEVAPEDHPTIIVAKDLPKPVAISSSSPVPVPSMVQVAAVSHQEDADSLVANLKRRGYAVAIHHEPQDKLLHVQIGPFPTHKEAETMRQRLLADGFNAIVK